MIAMKKSRLKLQQKIRIARPGGEWYKSSIQELDADTLSVSLPYYNGTYFSALRDELLRVEFSEEDAVYSFETTVVGRKKSNQVPLLVLARPKVLSRTQRRNFVRFPVLLPVRFRTISSGDGRLVEDVSPVNGKALDISGGGLQISSTRKVNENDTVMVNLALDDDNPRELTLCGTVNWVAEDSVTRTIRFGVRFDDIQEAEQERIISYIFTKMRQRTLS